MGQIDLDFLPLRVINVGANGKRSFAKGDKRRLVEACPQPGVLVASMAIKAGVNANQLRRWIEQYKAEQKNAAGTMDVIENAPAVFIPVVEVMVSARRWSRSGQPCPGQCLFARCSRRRHCRRNCWSYSRSRPQFPMSRLLNVTRQESASPSLQHAA
ncbi:transposase [Cupriavidus basilensis]|uniref:transposase n=1 Tax=Cupriavidus basilensis TaxID=68895 RepID=UPI00157B03E7|nr:transposase [Cupriavidus basilensis]NUA30628.1 hypothetical protein [Cupriavidus basilensis]